MIIIGIDPSMNSTGMCIWDTDKDTHTYYIIAQKITGKMKSLDKDFIKILEYDKSQVSKGSNTIEKEAIKTHNLYNIYLIIKQIVKEINPDIGYMEGVSYGSGGQVADLAGLNYMIRLIFMELNIPINIVPPTTNKKAAVGNGSADKDMMVYSWKMLDNRIKDINIKLDDLADAFFLAHFKVN